MSIAVLRKKTKFKRRSTGNRVDYQYTGQPAGLGYKGFSLNMSNRGTVTGRKFINSGVLSNNCYCSAATGIANNERQSSCKSCNKSVVAQQLSYRNYLTRATSSVTSIAGGKGLGIRARVIDTPGSIFANKAQVWKRAPSFDNSSYINNKKSAVIQCTSPGTTSGDCSDFPNKVNNSAKRNTCKVTMGKTSYLRMNNIPCNTTKNILNVTAGDQIARVKARRVCKASGSSGGKHCYKPYESKMMNDNQRKIC